MSYRINSNVSAVNAHRNLLSANERQEKSFTKLSSGQKINKAADGPAALMISERMRSQIASVKQAIDNSAVTAEMIKTAEGHFTEVSDLLINMRQLAIHASNEGANDPGMIMADQQELQNALNTINIIARQASFGNTKLFDGTRGSLGTVTSDELEVVEVAAQTKDSRDTGFDFRVTQNAKQSSMQSQTALTQEMIEAGETLTIIENGKMASLTTHADHTQALVLSDLQNLVRENGLKVNVTMDDSGAFQIIHKEYGKDYGFEVSSSTAGVLSQEAGGIESIRNGQDIKGNFQGEAAIGKGQVLTGLGGTKVEGLKVRFLGQAGEGEELPKEGVSVGKIYVTQNSASYQVGGNQGQSVVTSINSIMPDHLGRFVDNESGYESLADIDLSTYQRAQDSLTVIDKALGEVSSKRGELGAFQKNTLESNMQHLRVANENLISSESIIRDADMAYEMAEYTRNQIISKSATAMLAQANQSPRMVLKLLG